MTYTLCSSFQLTVLNAAYLGLMAKAGTADNFGTASIPVVLNLLFHGLNSKPNSQNATLVEMGKTQNQLQLNPTYNPAFGSWLSSSRVIYPRNFTLIEMKGLYGPLLNASQFGPFILSLAAQAAGSIGELLCPDPKSACFNISNPPRSLDAVGLFVRDLSKYVMWYLDANNYGLMTTRKQSEITLGYVMEKLPIPEYQNGIPVPGAVTSHVNESDVKTSSTFYTCESTDGGRFTYAGKFNVCSQNLYFVLSTSRSQTKLLTSGDFNVRTRVKMIPL